MFPHSEREPYAGTDTAIQLTARDALSALWARLR